MPEKGEGLDVVKGTVVMRSDLTDEEIASLNGVRKQIWKGGYAGFAVGGMWGLANCVLFKTLQRKALENFPNHPTIKSLPRLQNKHFVMWSLVAGAAGMFMGAGMEGMRGSESLREIYSKRADEAKNEPQDVITHARLPPDAPEYHVAKASADSHARRMAAINAKRRGDSDERDGTSKGGGFKAW